MNIYAMRHGFTRMNKEKLYNGQVDEDINEEGIEQAKAARETVKNMNFDVIYCSPLLRAKHTCEIVNCNNVPVIYDDRLKERTLGKLDGKDLPKEGLSMEDFYDAFTKGGASAGLAASLFHYKEIEIKDLKEYLKNKGVSVRL